MADKPGKNADVDAYIAGFAGGVQARLEKMRGAIAKAVPGAEETISYRIPTFKLDGRPLLYFAAFKAHIGLYPVTDDVKKVFANELGPYAQSKGTVRFPHEAALPLALVTKIAKFKARQILEANKAKSGPKRAVKSPAKATGTRKAR